MRLIGFEQVPDIDAEYVSDRLAELLPYDIGAATVSVPGTVTEYPANEQLASALDADTLPEGDVGLPELEPDGETPPDAGDESDDESENGGSVREQLRTRILAELDTEPRVGVPAVLGKHEHDVIRSEFETAMGARIFEIPTGAPSVSGYRLERRLHPALREAGVQLTSGDITRVESQNGRIEQVTVTSGADSAEEETLAVDAVILATGDLTTGGLRATRNNISEPRFDCPVTHLDQSAWTTANPLEPQPFSTVGVRIDERCRPLDEQGDRAYENLRVAGRLVGGADYDREASGDGVAIATGFVAGRSAVDWAVAYG